MKNKIKGLLALALAAFISLTWAATYPRMPGYTINSTSDVVITSPVLMPNQAVDNFTVTIKWESGNQRSDISQVELVDPETETQVDIDIHDGYSGNNSQANVYTLDDIPASYAGKVLLVKSTVRCNGAGSSTCRIDLSNNVVHASYDPDISGVISINFRSGRGSIDGSAGLVYAEGWLNIASDANNTELSGRVDNLPMWDGSKSAMIKAGMSYWAKCGWQYNAGVTDAFLNGYLDDGGSNGREGAEITLTGIPFSEYSVIVYCATDTESRKFQAVKINDSYYKGVSEEGELGYAVVAQGHNGEGDIWGSSLGKFAAYGTNALRVNGLSGDLTIEGGYSSGGEGSRGGIAAIQIVNTGDLTQYNEIITPDGIEYDYVFRGTTDASWDTLENWYTGIRTVNGDLITYETLGGEKIPCTPNSDLWGYALLDGSLIDVARGSDGYKTVTALELEGWNPKYTVCNGVHLKISRLNKIQGGAVKEWRVDDTSKITVLAGGHSTSWNKPTFYVNNKDGVSFEAFTLTNTGANDVDYYFDEDGSVNWPTISGTQKIKAVKLNIGDNTMTGRKRESRKLIGFKSSSATFNVSEVTATTTLDGRSANADAALDNIGDYIFEEKGDGFYVTYVAYAETDEIAAAASTWTKTTDAAWATETNWTKGVPIAGADAVITIAEDTTITIPAEGVSVGVLTVNGKGNLTINGGKITATKVIANAGIVTDANMLTLVPMEIAEGVTVAYTTTGESNSEVTLPEMTGKGVFSKFGSEQLTLENSRACEPQLIWNAGTLRFHAYAYDKTYNIVAKDGAKIQVGTWAGSLTSTSNTLKLEGGAMLQLNNGNSATGAIVKGTIVIDSTAEKPAVIKGNNNGNHGVIAATIKGNGVLEIQDNNDNYFTISGVIANGDAEGDVLAVKVVTDRGVTFTGANTYTGGTIVAEGGILKVQKMSALGAASTEVNIAKGGKVTVTSTGNVTEDAGVARAVFAGEGTVEFNGTGYYVLPNNFKAPAYLINNQADNLTIATDGTYYVGSYSGDKYFRMDYNQKGERAFVITQRADATIASDIVEMFGSINNDQRLTDVTVKGVDGATLTLSGAHNNIHFRTLTIDATGSVNLAGGWKGNVVANGKLAGEGAIGGTLTLADGATLAGAVTVTGDVAIEGGLTIDHATNAGDTVIICNNAADILASLPTAPTGLKYAVDGNTVKLAVAEVTVTLPTVSNAVWKDAEGNTITSITLAPNSSASVKLETTGDYVFADGSTSKDVTIASGDADSEATAPADASIVAAGAKIGDKLYTSLAAAVDAAEANATITLLADVSINSRLDIAQNVTIDLNGQTIAETMEDQFGAIYVKKGATLTIAATNGGEITTDGGIVIGNYGTVIVNGGTIAAGEDAEADVSIYNFYYQADWYGTTTINGGTVARIWNCGVATLAGGVVTDVDNSGAMEITDATVTNIILRDGTDAPGIEGAGTLTAPAGLTVTTMDGQTIVYADGKYTVAAIPVSDNVARIGETEYPTLEAAFEVVKDRETIVLLKGITANIVLPSGKTAILDLNGQTINGYITVTGNSNVTTKWLLQNGTVINTSTGTAAISASSATIELTQIDLTSYYHCVRLNANGVGIVNSGTYVINRGGGRHILYLSGANTSLTVNGGSFKRGTGEGETYCVHADGANKNVMLNGGMYYKADGHTTFYINGGAECRITGGNYQTNPSSYLASGYTVDTTINPGYYTVVEKPAIQLTIDLGDGVSEVYYTIAGNTTRITEDTTIDVAESGTVVSFTATVNGNYFAPTVADVTVTQNTTVTIAGVAFSAVESADDAITAANRDAVYAWAKNKGKLQSEISAAKYIYADYLFNFAEFSAAEPTIEITEFTADPLVIKAKVTVNGETKIADLSATGLNLNGTLKYKAAPTLEALEDATPKAALDATDRFFKVVVE